MDERLGWVIGRKKKPTLLRDAMGEERSLNKNGVSSYASIEGELSSATGWEGPGSPGA